MLTTGLNALALFRLGVSRGGGIISLLILLAIACVVGWALARPGRRDAAN